MQRLAISFLALLSAAGIAPDVQAQSCGSGQTLLKNDILPGTGGGPFPISVIQGLCEGEAAAAVFDVSSLGNSVRLHTAAIGYFNVGGANGIQAQVNLQVFDGISWNAGIPTLGPRIFDYSQTTGAGLGINSSAINETPSLSGFNIVATSGTLVVAWTMDLNPLGGNCLFGFQTNFATDNTCGPPGCSCTAGTRKNLIYIQGQGWRDASTAQVGFTRLCPNYYNGNWIIRACVEGVGCAAPVNLGPGSQGTGGIAPVVTTSGGNAQTGNANFGLTVAAALGGATSFVVLGTEQTFPFAGGSIYVIPIVAVPLGLGGPTGTPGAGFGTLSLPIPNNPSLIGAPLPVQSLVFDPGATFGLSLSNGLRIIIC